MLHLNCRVTNADLQKIDETGDVQILVGPKYLYLCSAVCCPLIACVCIETYLTCASSDMHYMEMLLTQNGCG